MPQVIKSVAKINKDTGNNGAEGGINVGHNAMHDAKYVNHSRLGLSVSVFIPCITLSLDAVTTEPHCVNHLEICYAS